MKRFLSSLIVFLSLVAQVQPAFASDAHDRPEDTTSLIAKIMAAYGGKNVITGIAGVSAVGDIYAFMRQDRGTYELLFKRPGKLRVETKYQRSFETRILNGSNGYRGTDETPLTQVKDHRFLAMVYHYKHFDLLYGFAAGLYSVSRQGTEDLNGKSVEVLRLVDQEGPPMEVYVDARTFFIVKVSGGFTLPGGRTTTLSTEFFDFRKVGDTLFPFKLVSYAGGQRIAETIMKAYRINPEMPDSSFAP